MHAVHLPLTTPWPAVQVTSEMGLVGLGVDARVDAAVVGAGVVPSSLPQPGKRKEPSPVRIANRKKELALDAISRSTMIADRGGTAILDFRLIDVKIWLRCLEELRKLIVRIVNF